MQTTLSRPRVVGQRLVDASEFEDSSPFGLQGLKRKALRLLKPDCISKLAVALAMHGSRDEIRGEGLALGLIARHPEWRDEYEVVHLIEKSLWINGRSDLVMTLTPNPSQIPDSPPQQIIDALTRAYVLHPEATVWYGVPLFGDQTTPDGLPIPLTAQEVREEQDRRIQAAREQALKYRWAYRAAASAAQVPSMIGRFARRVWTRGEAFCQAVSDYQERMRRDTRLRERVRMINELDYIQYGRCCTAMPEHTTFVGRIREQAMRAADIAAGRMATPAGMTALSIPGVALTIQTLIPLLYVPATVVTCDPFLFMELPDEPGKLRHLGHWFWQTDAQGKKRLHVHV
jgi:hypothetical protein